MLYRAGAKIIVNNFHQMLEPYVKRWNSYLLRLAMVMQLFIGINSNTDGNGCTGGSSNSVTVIVNSLLNNASILAQAVFTKYCGPC